MAREQFIGQGITVASAVGERFFDAATKVSDVAHDERTLAYGGIVVFVAYLGAMAAGLKYMERRREVRDDSNR